MVRPHLAAGRPAGRKTLTLEEDQREGRRREAGREAAGEAWREGEVHGSGVRGRVQARSYNCVSFFQEKKTVFFSLDQVD